MNSERKSKGRACAANTQGLTRSPITAATPGSAGKRTAIEHDMEPVTITLRRTDWQLILDYFQGDIEAMGDNAPMKQMQARRAADWIAIRVAKGNANKRAFRSLPNTQGVAAGQTTRTKREGNNHE